MLLANITVFTMEQQHNYNLPSYYDNMNTSQQSTSGPIPSSNPPLHPANPGAPLHGYVMNNTFTTTSPGPMFPPANLNKTSTMCGGGVSLENAAMYSQLGMLSSSNNPSQQLLRPSSFGPIACQTIAPAPLSASSSSFDPLLVFQHQQQRLQESSNSVTTSATCDYNAGVSDTRAKQNRDRNREHARTTRLRKKAYVTKLKDLVENLHSQRTEDMRQRRVAIQHLSEVQGVRRQVVRTFLQYFCQAEADERQWEKLIEEKFWLKEPVTPYRSFRRAEIEKVCVRYS
jgi:hypothetical protein